MYTWAPPVNIESDLPEAGNGGHKKTYFSVYNNSMSDFIKTCILLYTRAALTCETRRALTGVDSNGVMTDATITTRAALAVIDVNLAAVTSETDGAHTSKRVDQIVAYAAIQTWIQLTLVNVNLTLCARETCNSTYFSTCS
jgi:hypothetical protein